MVYQNDRLETIADGELRCAVDSTFNRYGDITNSHYTDIGSSGNITLVGDARVYRNEWINITAIRVPSAGVPATAADYGIGFAWDFTDGNDDQVIATLRIPQGMDRSVAPELKIGWGTDDTDTDHYATWQLEYLWVGGAEDLTGAAQETLSVNSYAVTQADGLIIATITGIDVPASTDQLIVMRVTRKGSTDTLDDDAFMVGMGLKYTANKLGVAI